MAQSIQKSLTTIIEWFQKHCPETLEGLNPGATLEEINHLEERIGMTLPEGFTNFLTIHNGESWESSCILGDFNRLLSCNEIVDQYVLDQEIGASVDDPEFSTVEFLKDRITKVIYVKGSVKPILTHPKWIPISVMNGDIYRYIDFDPAPSGVEGQIIEVDREGCSYEVLADSFDQFLERYAQQLIEGIFGYDPEYGAVVFKGNKDVLQWGVPEWIKNLR